MALTLATRFLAACFFVAFLAARLLAAAFAAGLPAADSCFTACLESTRLAAVFLTGDFFTADRSDAGL